MATGLLFNLLQFIIAVNLLQQGTYIIISAFFINLSTYKSTDSCLEDHLIQNGRHQHYPEPDESHSHPHAIFTLK
jgi:hypothetical protein